MSQRARLSVLDRLGDKVHRGKLQGVGKVKVPGQSNNANVHYRGKHAYQNKNFPSKVNQRLQKAQGPVLMPDCKPQPLFDPATVERLRANLRLGQQVRENIQMGPYDDGPLEFFTNEQSFKNEGVFVNYQDNAPQPVYDPQDYHSQNHRAWENEAYAQASFEKYCAEESYRPEQVYDAAQDYAREQDSRLDQYHGTLQDSFRVSESPPRFDFEEEIENMVRQDTDNEMLELNDYLRKEQEAKEKIDKIIMVAQALRDKLEKTEQIKRAALEIIAKGRDSDNMGLHANKASKSNLEFYQFDENCQIPQEFPASHTQPDFYKPKLPSLLDLQVPPPPIEDVFRENIIVSNSKFEFDRPDICWNCEKRGHRFRKCTLPLKRNFCFSCGRPGFDVSSCLYCRSSRPYLT